MALQCHGGAGHLIEDSLLLDADPPPRDDPLAFHPDAIHCSQGTDGVYAQDVTIRRNWLSSPPTVKDADDANMVIIQSTPETPARNMLIEDNVVIAGGLAAVIVNRPQDCIIRRNTVIDRDGTGQKPRLSIRDRGMTGLNTRVDGNVVPQPTFILGGAASGITVTGETVVTRDDYADALDMTGPVETWRAVPGGALDGVGSPLLWSGGAEPEPTDELAQVTAQRDAARAALRTTTQERDAARARIAAARAALRTD